MLSIGALRGGMGTFFSQYFVIAGLFFVIPVYLQTILQYDALKTGVKLIPLSIGLVLFSALGSRLATVRSAKYISRFGQLAMAVGALIVMASVNVAFKSALFWVGMFIIGVGFGLLASQLGNVNMSAVNREDTSEVGGLQGTFQNLGTSFGTAVVGSIFMLTLTSGFTSAVQQSPDLGANAKSAIVAESKTGVQIVSQSQAEHAVISHGGSPATADTVATLYRDSQIQALKQALFVVFVVALLSLMLSRNLPKTLAAPARS
jgi:hypothetical protein